MPRKAGFSPANYALHFWCRDRFLVEKAGQLAIDPLDQETSKGEQRHGDWRRAPNQWFNFRMKFFDRSANQADGIPMVAGCEPPHNTDLAWDNWL